MARVCPVCEGTGETVCRVVNQHMRSWMACPECNGAGMVERIDFRRGEYVVPIRRNGHDEIWFEGLAGSETYWAFERGRLDGYRGQPIEVSDGDRAG